MEPTYQQGDIVLVEEISASILPPQRGDIIVFHDPHDPSSIDIKRVVGLPNEDVTIGENNVTITYPDGHAQTFGADTSIGRGATGFFSIKLGPEDYFVLGDNRSHSTDSRNFGAVQPQDIVGRVIMNL